MGNTRKDVRLPGMGTSDSAAAARLLQVNPPSTAPPTAAEARKLRRERLSSWCHGLSGQQ
jgi:hypothetical protein